VPSELMFATVWETRSLACEVMIGIVVGIGIIIGIGHSQLLPPPLGTALLSRTPLLISPLSPFRLPFWDSAVPLVFVWIRTRRSRRGHWNSRATATRPAVNLSDGGTDWAAAADWNGGFGIGRCCCCATATGW
jgi:hypothetical protein